MAYSLDFRKQVFKVKQKEGSTFEQTSERFSIPIRTLFRWKNRIEPKTERDKPATKTDMVALADDVKEHPGSYQFERAKKFGVGQSAILYALRRLKTSYKKTLFHPKADRLSRLLFQIKIFRYEFIEKRPIVYVDKSGFAVDAPREKGYSSKGERCYAKKDWHAKGRVNAIGAVNDFKLLDVCSFNTNTNSIFFMPGLHRNCPPNVPDNAVIVLDNATFHKQNDMKYAIEEQGYILEFLPLYSPDLNPIEKMGTGRGYQKKI